MQSEKDSLAIVAYCSMNRRIIVLMFYQIAYLLFGDVFCLQYLDLFDVDILRFRICSRFLTQTSPLHPFFQRILSRKLKEASILAILNLVFGSIPMYLEHSQKAKSTLNVALAQEAWKIL